MASGIRLRQHDAMPVSPMATLRMSSPDEAWTRSAPAARRPASTTVNEPAKPTTDATTPAITGWASDRVMRGRG